eukprot:1978211-Pleurochrysis_carterae.AAC.1
MRNGDDVICPHRRRPARSEPPGLRRGYGPNGQYPHAYGGGYASTPCVPCRSGGPLDIRLSF